MYRIFNFLFVFFIGMSLKASSKFPNHAYYLSICQIEYNQQTKSYEISIRFFSNDFEKAIDNYKHIALFKPDGSLNKNANVAVLEYLKQNFRIYTKNGKELNYNFIGWESDKSLIWCYLEIRNDSFYEILKIKNKILTEIYERQKNIVYFKSGIKEGSILLDKNKSEGFIHL